MEQTPRYVLRLTLDALALRTLLVSSASGALSLAMSPTKCDPTDIDVCAGVNLPSATGMVASMSYADYSFTLFAIADGSERIARVWRDYCDSVDCLPDDPLSHIADALPCGLSRTVSNKPAAFAGSGAEVPITRGGAAMGALAGAFDSYGYNARSEVVSARRTLGGAEVSGFAFDYAYDPIGNRTSATEYDESGAPLFEAYAANELNQYTRRTVPGYAAVRGEADTNAFVTVNERPVARTGEFFHGGNYADNTLSNLAW